MMKPIPGYPGYFASDDGHIWSNKRGHGDPKKLAPSYRGRAGNDYRVVSLCRAGKTYQLKIAPLVLSTFVGARPDGMFACHGPLGRYDDSIGNLRWATPHDNNLDQVRDGAMHIGERHHKHKLNQIQIRIIRRAYSPWNRGGLGSGSLSHVFRVNKSTILRIAKHCSWKHIP